MIFRPRLLTVAVALALGPGAGASALALDLHQAYRDSLANDALVASARSALDASRERVTQAQATLLPGINASAAATRQIVNSNIGPRRDFTTQSYGVNLSFPLFRLQNIVTVDQSKLQVAVFEAQLEQAMQDLMIRVSQAYFDVLASQDSLGTIRSQKRAITEQLASAKRNFEVGTATITDQQEAQSRYDLTIAQELAGENDLAVKLAALTLLTGKPLAELDVLRGGLTLQGPQPAREAEWASSAREHNLAVQQAQVAIEVAKREIDKQRYGHYPTLDLVSGLNRSTNPSVTLFGFQATTASLGLQLNVPLYAGGGVDARVREAVALREKSSNDLENARRQAEQGARTAFLGVNSGLGQVKALEAAEKSSQLALDSNLLGYQVGVRINIDVLNAQQQLYTTRRDLAKARYDVLVNGLRLKQTAGTLQEDDLQAVNGLLTARPPDPPASAAAPPASPPSSGTGTGTAGTGSEAKPAAAMIPGSARPRIRGGRLMRPTAPPTVTPAPSR